MWIPRCGGLLQSGFLISGTWIPEIPIVCETPDSLGCIQRPKPRIPDYLTSDKIVIFVLSCSGSPSSQIKLSQKLLWPIHTQFPAALFAPVKGLVGRGSRGGGGFYMKCLKCSSSFWEIGQKASIFIIKLLFRIFSNEYMQRKPNSFKTGLKTALKFNIRLGSSMLTYPDRPCKNGNMWPYDWKKS